MERSAWKGIVARFMRPLRIWWARWRNKAYYDEVTDSVYCGRDVYIAEAWLAHYHPQAPEEDEDDKELVEV